MVQMTLFGKKAVEQPPVGADDPLPHERRKKRGAQPEKGAELGKKKQKTQGGAQDKPVVVPEGGAPDKPGVEVVPEGGASDCAVLVPLPQGGAKQAIQEPAKLAIVPLPPLPPLTTLL